MADTDSQEEGSPKERRKAKPSARKGFLLRLPPEVLTELKGWAAQDLRSLNGQIEFILRDALKKRRGAKDGD
ncbi:MAG: Arc family DNA-binding protein [Planctomycetota bacterium]